MSAARRYEQSRAPLHHPAQFRSTAGLAAAAATQRPLQRSGRPGRSDVRVLAASNFLSAAQDRVPGLGRQAVHAPMVKSAFWKPALVTFCRQLPAHHHSAASVLIIGTSRGRTMEITLSTTA